jgi:Flp pilus assembly protein TadD/TolB-like protein
MSLTRRFPLILVLLAAAAVPARAQPDGGILVLPFENTQREARGGWIGEAAAILIADGLAARGLPAITRSERVRAYERLQLPVSAAVSRATVIKVGEILGASEVIGGSYRLDGDELIVEAHSIRIDIGQLQPHVAQRGALKELFTIFERLAERLAPGAPRVAPAGTHPPLAAFESYVKGLLAEHVATQATFLETAIRDAPQFERARLALWQVRHEQADHAAALAAVTPLNGESFLARRGRLRAGVSQLQMKAYADAAATFTSLLDPALLQTTAPAAREYAPILNNLGIVQLRRDTPPPTAGSPAYYLTRAADADPEEPDYQFNLGYAYVLDGNHTAALYWLREALRRDVADADAHYLLAVALHATGNATEAAREHELAQQLSARYEELGRASAGKLIVPRGLERLRLDLDGPGARPNPAFASAAQREQQDLAAFHLERGQVLFAREQDREAMAELRRVVYLSPYAAPAHVLIGRIHLRAGRPADAIDALKISVWSEDTAAARTALAEAYLSIKNTAAARHELRRALQLEPAFDEARRLLETLPEAQQ